MSFRIACVLELVFGELPTMIMTALVGAGARGPVSTRIRARPPVRMVSGWRWGRQSGPKKSHPESIKEKCNARMRVSDPLVPESCFGRANFSQAIVFGKAFFLLI